MKKLLALATSILFSIISFTQNGFVAGKVVDQSTGEELIGVAIMVKGSTKGTSTDIDGTYKLELAPGTYDLQVSYISYQTKVIPGVVVKAKEITALNITLQSAEKELGEVVIEATVDRETSSALVLEQKNSVVLFDGISAEAIRKTPDRNTAEVLRRVSGATIQDNFVIIRGLPDRYNAAFINGSPLPSSEPDRKAFSFDIFPSALLNDLKVIKTAMPSLTGEFAGGIIQVSTKNIPDKNYYSISLGTTFNTITTFSEFRKENGGSTDFFGIDDGTRQLPAAFPSNEEMVNSSNNNNDKLVEYARLLKNNFPVKKISASPGLSFQYSMGHNFNLIPKSKRDNTTGKKEFGSVFGLTYNNMFTRREIERNDFDLVGKLVSYLDNQFTINTLWGALWNVAFISSKPNGSNNRITLKNMFNVNTNDQHTYREGIILDQQFDVRSYNTFYSQNMLLSTHLNGEHSLPKSKIKFEWGAGYSRLNRIIPDYKVLQYRRDATDTLQPFFVPFSGTVQQSIASRFFSNQIDNIYSGTFDFSYPFKIGATRHELKIGSYLQYKDRDFGARVLGYTTYGIGGADMPQISVSAIDTIFQSSHFSNQGLVIKEVTRKSDTYAYFATTAAGYIQLENSFFDNKLKFVWGARFESFRQNLTTYTSGDTPINLDTTVNDILPSINIIYGFHPKFNIRLSGSQTVTRPESRELAPFTFYDYSIFALAGGNSNLKRTKITNADLRFEWYPQGGQIVSVSGFFKYFENPIEKVLFTGATNRTFTYINVPYALAAGAELEYKVNIGSLLSNSHARFFDGLSLIGNFAYIYSNVNVADTLSGTEEQRSMQGQSPYIINASIQYNDSKYDFGFTLSFNYIGPRIWSVGNYYYPSIIENPRPILDVQITKSFLKKALELRLNFKDLIAYDGIFYQDNNLNNVYDDSVDNLMIRQRVGQQISFSIGFKF
ncbi:MAG: carboxypeptidase-like regulatory domain-containing protein [Flavobacteriales bacterium]|nr:carboxypeptidase-like regulatory domain-containing protein [Flavobacteriales bacterium]